MAPLSLKLFGNVELVDSSNNVVPLPRKTQMLLTYLAANGGEQIPRDRVAGLIWHDRAEEQARHSLRQCLFTLAKSTDDSDVSLVLSDRQSVTLNPVCVDVDTWDFEHLLREDTTDSLAQATALHRDEFAVGLSFDDETLDAWCAAERTRYGELCYEALAKLSSRYGDMGRMDEALAAARRLVALDPMREDGHRTLMRLFDRAGRRAEALKQYRHCHDILRAELNVAPEAATQSLYGDIKGRGGDADVSPPIDDLPAIDYGTDEPVGRAVNYGRQQIAFAAGAFLIIVIAAAAIGLSLG